MPQLRSFSAFAKGPDLVGAASTARNQILEAQKLAINTQLQRQQLAQQAQQALMRHQVDLMQLDASRKAAQSEANIAQQNIELKKAYDSQRLGMMDRQLAIEETSAASKAQQALEKYKLESEYRDLVKSKMAGGMDIEKAAREAGMQTGWRGWQGLPSAAIPGGTKQAGDETPMLTPIDVPGYGKAYRTSKTGYRMVPDVEPKVPMLVGPEYNESIREVPLSMVPNYYSGLSERMKTNSMNLNAMEQARGAAQNSQQPQSTTRRKTLGEDGPPDDVILDVNFYNFPEAEAIKRDWKEGKFGEGEKAREEARRRLRQLINQHNKRR